MREESLRGGGALALPPAGPGGDSSRTVLELRGVRSTRASFELRVFLDQADAGPATPTEGHPRYAGSLFFYGHGEEAPKVEPIDLRLDVTEAIQALTRAGVTSPVAVTFTAVNNKSLEIANPELSFDAMVLLASD